MEIHHSPHTTALNYRIPLSKKVTRFFLVSLFLLVITLTILTSLIWYQTKAPENFPAGELVEIEEGTSVRDIAKQLH